MTLTFSIHLDLEVKTTATDEQFDEHTDAVLDHLIDLDGIANADMTASIAEHTVSFSVWVDADDPSAALDTVYAAVRTAIHAENGATPGWEDALRRARADVKPARQRDLVAT